MGFHLNAELQCLWWRCDFNIVQHPTSQMQMSHVVLCHLTFELAAEKQATCKKLHAIIFKHAENSFLIYENLIKLWSQWMNRRLVWVSAVEYKLTKSWVLSLCVALYSSVVCVTFGQIISLHFLNMNPWLLVPKTRLKPKIKNPKPRNPNRKLIINNS